MKKSLFTISAVCLLSALLFSCHKPDEIQAQSTYTFINTTGKRITFDVYASKDDYDQNTHRLQQYFIAPGMNRQIGFEAPKTYWVDWYSESYLLNNWRSPYGNGGGFTNPGAQLNIAAENDTYNLGTNLLDTSRSVLINGGDFSSTWLATITDNPLLNGTHKFQFRKDFQGEYTYTDTQGVINKQAIKYYIRYNTGTGIDLSFGIDILNEAPDVFCDADCIPKVFAGRHTGRDTLLISFRQFGSVDIPAVRQ